MTVEEYVRDGRPVTVETPATGVRLTNAAFERVVSFVRDGTRELFGDEVRDHFRAPPVIASDVIARTGYPETFPHLLGAVRSRAKDDLFLTPAACHHTYPLIAGAVLDEPWCVGVEATCFRDEGTDEIGRLRSFRMSEVVFAGIPEACLDWRDTSLRRVADWLGRLGLDVAVEVADDPFIGPGAKLMRATQREQQLKWELRVPVGDGPRQAVASCNYHKEHFSVPFGFRGPGDTTLHSACTAFGLERIALALIHASSDLVSDGR